MFIETALLYPAVLTLLCVGAGLLVDALSGRLLSAALLPVLGAALLIALSQLTTYIYPLAPATPYLIGATALTGLALARARLHSIARRLRTSPWLYALPLLVYVIALAPVLVDGRPSFSSYMALADSAVHMLGAAFLLSHGQHYVHLDLRNSYGQYINDYYNSSYPSGADTLFGASAQLLRLPLIWTFQPFNAFMLAIASGPAWQIARRMRLRGTWAALAAMSAVLGALVYAYELFGSVKEVTALAMILALGALVCTNERWLHARAGARAGVPFALVIAAGVSALGVAFGVWALIAAMALAVPLLRAPRRDRGMVRATGALLALAVGVVAIAALPTWAHPSGSVGVASGIASTSNPGNLAHPLRATQLLGVWLGGSYKRLPTGTSLSATYVLVALGALSALLGAVNLFRRREYTLLVWLALMLAGWLAVAQSVTTWGGAKALMLTSPVAVLLAWAGVAALRELRLRALSVVVSTVLALALVGGVLASDAMQYHVSNLAPTARYDELASLDSRFAGQGPTLFSDFDEYSMYELRDLDVGGPDFVYPPAALASAAAGHGQPVDLNRLAPAALASYPLIVTRREPRASRPPAAYTLAWEGAYYKVWRRVRGAPPALAHVPLTGSAAQRCARIERVAASARHGAGSLVVARAPQAVAVSLARASHPRGWGRERAGLVMSTPGQLRASFKLPHAGVWRVWVQGQIMPTVALALDGHALASIAGQLDGNSLVPDTVPPIAVSLGAGEHTITLAREHHGLAPGDGGAAVLDAIVLTPAEAGAGGELASAPVSRWRSLCAASDEWVELLGSVAARA